MDFWKKEENISIKDQINKYFQFLEKQKESEKRDEKETLIIKFKNISDSEINNLLEKMNKLEHIYYMPLILILFKEYKGENEEEINKIIKNPKFENIDSR